MRRHVPLVSKRCAVAMLWSLEWHWPASAAAAGQHDPKGRSLAKQAFLALTPTWTGWRIQDVPNPNTNPSECHMPAAGTLCDPDGVLTPYGRERVQNVMDLIRQNTSAGCASQSSSSSSPPGFQVAAAVIGRMSREEFVHGDVEETGQRFARGIGDHWGVGDAGCDTGVIIFLSIEDREAYVATGHGAQKVLTDDLARQVVENMKPLLRAQRYDEALLQATLQIFDVFRGRALPEPEREEESLLTWILHMLLTALGLFCCCCCLVPEICVVCCFWGALALLPCCWLADRCGWERRKREAEAAGREEEAEARRQAQAALGAVQAELQRDEFDQSLCPICLESLEPTQGSHSQSQSREACLQCGHRYHRACIEPWLQQRGSCPLCRCDATLPLVLPQEEAQQPEEYQRRLRGYLTTLQALHPRAFQPQGTSPTYLYGRDQRGFWVLCHTDYVARYDCERTHVSLAASYWSSLNSHYESAMSEASSLGEVSRTFVGASARAFGGGSVSSGGGGGGRW